MKNRYERLMRSRVNEEDRREDQALRMILAADEGRVINDLGEFHSRVKLLKKVCVKCKKEFSEAGIQCNECRGHVLGKPPAVLRKEALSRISGEMLPAVLGTVMSRAKKRRLTQRHPVELVENPAIVPVTEEEVTNIIEMEENHE